MMFVPIYSSPDEIFTTIDQSCINNFLEKYIINDCPEEAQIEIRGIIGYPERLPFEPITKEGNSVSFIKESDYFRLYTCNNIDTYRLICGFDSKDPEKLKNLFTKEFLTSSVLFKNKINEQDMHSFIFGKFSFLSNITLKINDKKFFVNVGFEDIADDKNIKIIGFLPLEKMSRKEKVAYIVDDLYKFLSSRENSF